MNILIVGASSDLGSHLTRSLLSSPHRLRLLTHKRPVPLALPRHANAEIVQADLGNSSSLIEVCKDIECIVYVAGVLFRPRPAKFLPQTNTVYVQNIAHSTKAREVKSGSCFLSLIAVH